MSDLLLELPKDCLLDLWVIYNFSIKSKKGDVTGLSNRLLHNGLRDFLDDSGHELSIIENHLRTEFIEDYVFEAVKFITLFNPLVTKKCERRFRTVGDYSYNIEEFFELKNKKVVYGLEVIHYLTA